MKNGRFYKLIVTNEIIYFCVEIYIIYTILNVMFSTYIGIPRIAIVGLNIFKYSFYFIAILGTVYCLFKKDTKIIVYVILILIFQVFNWLLYINVPERYSSYISNFLTICIPLSVFSYYLESEIFLRNCSTIGIFTSLVYGITIIGLYAGIIQTQNNYNTSIGYSALLPEMCIMHQLKSESGAKRILMIISVILYCAFIFLYSSRGPLLIIILFAIFEFVCTQKAKKFDRGMIAVIILLAAFFVLTIFVDDILIAVSHLLLKRGINSRTLNLLLTDVGHSSGRDLIYQQIIEEIISNPLSIRGIASDTIIIVGNQYTHNIFLELLYEFGIILGGFFCVIILINAVSSLKYEKYCLDPLETILVIYAIGQLMFSSTIWMNCYFWIWIVRRIKNHYMFANRITVFEKEDEV